jgi:hypothetical protein
MVRVLAMDPASKKLYSVTAGYSVPPQEAGKVLPPVFHPDSFTVLSYAPVQPTPPRDEEKHGH